MTPQTSVHQASLSFTISCRLLRFMSIELVMLSNCLIFCRPLLLLPSIFPSIRVFFNELALHIRWQKYWKFIISPLSSSKLREQSNSFTFHCFRRGQWYPTPVLLPGKSMDGGAWWAAVHGVAKSRARLSDFTFMHWRRKWQPTPVFLPGESQGRGSLVGYRLWGHTESDATETT